MFCKRFSWLIVLTLCVLALSFVRGPVLAESFIAFGEEEMETAAPTEGLSPAKAAEGYIHQEMYGTRKNLMNALRAAIAYLSLNPGEQRLYDAMKEHIVSIAAGETESTVFWIPTCSVYEDHHYTAEELGIDSLMDAEGKITEEAKYAFWARQSVDFNRVKEALLLDTPYELYWYDKTTKNATKKGIPALSIDENNTLCIYAYDSAIFSVRMPVCAEYSVTGEKGTYSIDTSYGTAVKAAVTNARQIVSENAGKTDIQKLSAYATKICDLTDYNKTAATSTDTPYGNPWQLVWVFDGDPETTVVCEGYSKAFQYLCDLSSFGGDVEVITVTGKLNNGNHMWNLVTLSDSYRYLVDVTNMDTGHDLFLRGYSEKLSEYSYLYRAGSARLTYFFDESTYELYSERLDPDPVWTFADGTLTLIEAGDTNDYTSSADVPWAADLANIRNVVVGVNVTGLGDHVLSGLTLDTLTLPSALAGVSDTALEGTTVEQVVINCCTDWAASWVISQGYNYTTLNHSWGEPAYEWNEDHTAVTATRVCVIPGHVETETADTNPTVTLVPTCTAKGKTTYTSAFENTAFVTQAIELEDIDALGHDPVHHDAKAATCTEIGWNAYDTCSRCDYSTYAEIAALGHTEAIDVAVAPTCTDTGLTEGKHCSVCNTMLLAQTVVPAKGHTEVVDAAVAPTCTDTGLTEGKHCSVCNTILLAQSVVPAKGHTEAIDSAVAPTCTADGLTEGSHCSVCNTVLKAQEKITALGHKEVIDQAVPATIESTGLTEGKHCDRCGIVLVAQQVIPKIDPIEAFVTRCYQVILGRGVDEEGLVNWSAALRNGTAQASQIIDGIVSSQEYALKNLNHEASVKVLYQAMLGREPDPAGLAAWTKVLDDGYPFGSVINGFCGSTEFINICNRYGIQPGSVNVGPVIPKPADDTPRGLIEGFVKRCYVILLERGVDPTGLKDWSDALESGVAQASQIIDGIVNSQEFQLRGLTNEQKVDCLYMAMLGRGADPDGRTAWVQALVDGYPYAAIINGFCGSIEFGNICAEYHIQPGSVAVQGTMVKRVSIDPENADPAAPVIRAGYNSEYINEEKIRAFVEHCYASVLGRQGDAEGIEAYTKLILDGKKTPKRVAYEFVFSPEFQGRLPGNEEFIRILYKLYLNREPGAEELSGWVEMLEGGTGLEEIVKGFAESAEFKAIVNSMKE